MKRNVNIYEVIVDGGTCKATLLDSREEDIVGGEGFKTDNFNGNALEPNSCRFYYGRLDRKDPLPATLDGSGTGYSNDMWFYDISGDTTTYSGKSFGGIGGGGFRGRDYYYIAQRTNKLRKITFNHDGTVNADTNVCDLDSDLMYASGDVTFDPSDGMMYGSVTTITYSPNQYKSSLFKMDVSDCNSHEIAAGSLYGAGALQIAFGLSDGILYGHSASDGKFYTIDKTTGGLNKICDAIYKSDITNPPAALGGIDDTILKFSDLTEGSCYEPIQGCTPGYWKNHLDSWPTGYQPDKTFVGVFGVEVPDHPDLTLEDAVNLKGGKGNALARHAVAALLNAKHSGVEYGFSAGYVIAGVVAAFGGSEDPEAVKDEFEEFNEQICPLN